MRVLSMSLSLIAITLAACGSTSTPVPESTPDRVSQQPKESSPAYLLSEDSAISILRTYLQDCILSWDVEHELHSGGE